MYLRVFSNASTLRVRWPKYWSFSFSISPSNEHPGLISFRMDRLDLLAVQGTLKSLLQHHSSKASILWRSAFFIFQLSHPYMTTGKTTALNVQTFVGNRCYPEANPVHLSVCTLWRSLAVGQHVTTMRSDICSFSWLNSISALQNASVIVLHYFLFFFFFGLYMKNESDIISMLWLKLNQRGASQMLWLKPKSFDSQNALTETQSKGLLPKPSSFLISP